MARQYFTPIEYPLLEPEEFISYACRNGLNLTQAYDLSGFPRKTWEVWLYSKSSNPRRPYMERLHRVATDMGWMEVSHA